VVVIELDLGAGSPQGNAHVPYGRKDWPPAG